MKRSRLGSLCLGGSLIPVMFASPASAARRLRVDPPAVVLEGPRSEQQLLVNTTTPDGRVEDVTRKAVYDAPTGWLSVKDGRVHALRDGRGQLRIRYRNSAGRTVAVRGSGPIRSPSP